MFERCLKDLLKDVQNGKIDIDTALERLKDLPFSDLGFAKVNLHRLLRKGFPEVILCQGKTISQIKEISTALLKTGQDLLATRADEAAYQAIKEVTTKAIYHKEARVVVVKQKEKRLVGKVLVVTGGTGDIPIAEEAAITAEVMGSGVDRLYDVGAAGIHRLLSFKEKLAEARLIIAIAGMEGALPSIIAGLVACPVIAVPTSVGYGASFQGLAALLTMLNSCAPGVAVVNIDNGFGAGYLAAVINQSMVEEKPAHNR